MLVQAVKIFQEIVGIFCFYVDWIIGTNNLETLDPSKLIVGDQFFCTRMHSDALS